MALEITTVGAKVVYAWESSSGVRPTTGFTELPDVNEAPEFDLSLETIDASNITDTITRYVPGRQDPGGDAAYTLNHTNAVITAWKGLVTTAATKYATGLRLWWAYVYPDASDAYYWCGRPLALGSSGISQNALSTIPAHCAVNEIHGWDTKPTITTA
jgi:hypothetical protein